MSFKRRFSTLYLISFLCFSIASLHASEGGIEVSGAAKVSVVPDMATFSFAINTRGRILVEVKADVDKKTETLVNLCKKLGIETRKITSSEVTINPQYNFQTKSLIGFDVARNVKVSLYDLKKYNDLVNGAVDSGITTIRNITLDTQDRDKLEQRLLASALNAAKQKAIILAESAGVHLGKVQQIREAGMPMEAQTYRFRESVSAAPMAQGVFEPGEITVNTTVYVKYSIK